MIINFNIKPELFKRLVEAIERLASDYATVNSARLRQEAFNKEALDKKVGKTYYQSDEKVYEKELEEKRRRIEEYGPEE